MRGSEPTPLSVVSSLSENEDTPVPDELEDGLFIADPEEPLGVQGGVSLFLPLGVFVEAPGFFAAGGEPSRSAQPTVSSAVGHGSSVTEPPPGDYDLSVLSSAEQAMPRPGSTLDKYAIEEVVGSGGFAVVYRARHLILDKLVAIKMLRPEIARQRPHLVELLCDEARFVARINHPNVVRIYDVTRNADHTYLVLELIHGWTLSHLIKRKGALPVDRVLQIGLDVIAGLRAGLREGIIHRDIKPANILVSKDGVAKIVDLGLGYAVGRAEAPTTAEIDLSGGDKRRGGSLVGTPGYAAPEQVANSRNIDFRADIFSLAVTLLHALLGRSPFADRTQPMVVPWPEPGAFPRPLPSALETVLMAMLDPRPEGRPPSYEYLGKTFSKILSQLLHAG